MEQYQRELTQIKTILKNNTKGMTVTDIAREMNINRNSVAKYLDILLISGQAEMIAFGPAKVFFPCRRIPISSLLNYISDYVVILDEELRIQQINEGCLAFFNKKKEETIGEKIQTIVLQHFQDKILNDHIKNALKGTESVHELCITIKTQQCYLHVRCLPTTFEDGRQGVTCVFTDVTEKRRIQNIVQAVTNKPETNKKNQDVE